MISVINILIFVFELLILSSPETLSINADNKDGTYSNPIIFADYSDPDVIKVNDDYYMVSSSFSHFPGLPILHSKDLVNWKLIGHAVKEYPFEEFNIPQHGNGIWAPSIRYHNGEFWIYFGDPDHGILMTKTKDPSGDWEKLNLVKEGKGLIDACPFWDDDGNAYLVHAWAKSRAGINGILTVNKMSADGKSFIGEGVDVYDGKDINYTIEGPKFYKKNNYYYIFAPAGGVTYGWQTVLRSKNIFGPYEAKKILEQGSTEINGPHQGAWIELEDQSSWFIHFQDRKPYGRIVHLQPMFWENDWPKIGVDYDGNGIGEPVLVYDKPLNISGNDINSEVYGDDFNSGRLSLQWQWQANYSNDWYSLNENVGYLRLYNVSANDNPKNMWDIPNIIAQKFPAEKFDVTIKINFNPGDLNDKSGIIVFGSNYAKLELSKSGENFKLSQIICNKANDSGTEQVLDSVLVAEDEVFLKVYVREGARCNFAFSLDGKNYSLIGSQFIAEEGRWVGAKIGIYSISDNNTSEMGYADFDFFSLKNID